MKRTASLLLLGILSIGCDRGLSKEDWLHRLSQGDPIQKRQAALALGRLGPAAKEAVPDLIVLLQEGDEQGRWSAAVALGKMGAEATEAIPALETAARDDDSGEIRDTAAESIEKIKRRSGQYQP